MSQGPAVAVINIHTQPGNVTCKNEYPIVGRVTVTCSGLGRHWQLELYLMFIVAGPETVTKLCGGGGRVEMEDMELLQLLQQRRVSGLRSLRQPRGWRTPPASL